jgi:hypothetical protein
MFKLNGYTFGERTVPVAVMAMVDMTRTRLNQDASGNIVSPKAFLLQRDWQHG